ncbi:large conductance mechanosensitive channel protein MscL [Enterococcus timonensis]|uniref:large conductance mechanosensitive channel protein MscL n=1 Tax=Enterococcus timonensis TaxID=1852364 RepID=UPI0008DB0F56|nr:large conductance mechanosensitive channel protein MscL [Enterococcus timonensis]
MIKEFKTFIMRGSVVDLAVGVVIGAAFTGVVTSVVQGFITPLVSFVISLITGNSDGTFSGMKIRLGQTDLFLDFDLLVNALLAFLITAFVLFFIVKGINHLKSLGKKEEDEKEAEKPSAEETYLKEIRDLLAKQDKK